MGGPTTAPIRGATRRATSVGTRASVSSGPWGPCCSVEPTGTMTVSWSRRKASTSGLVMWPRNTVRGFMAMSSLRCGSSMSGDDGGELADALDPGRHHVTRLEVTIRTEGFLEAGRGAGRDEVSRLERDVATQDGDDLGDREPHRCGGAVLDRAAIDRGAEPEVGGVELVGGDDPR